MDQFEINNRFLLQLNMLRREGCPILHVQQFFDEIFNSQEDPVIPTSVHTLCVWTQCKLCWGSNRRLFRRRRPRGAWQLYDLPEFTDQPYSFHSPVETVELYIFTTSITLAKQFVLFAKMSLELHFSTREALLMFLSSQEQRRLKRWI